MNIGLDWPDERIGLYFLASRLGAEAVAHGISPDCIPPDLAETWRLKLAQQEADRVTDIPWEKAQRLAAEGKYTQAGAIFRAHMADSALRVKDETVAASARAHRAKLSENSKAGAEVRRKYSEADRVKWRVMAEDAGLAQHSRRRCAELIAERLDLPAEAVETIRRAI